MTRITKRDVLIQMHHLSEETGIGLELEDASIRREGKTRFNLWQIDENNKRVRELIPEDFTAKEMYQIIKGARKIYEWAMNQDS